MRGVSFAARVLTLLSLTVALMLGIDSPAFAGPRSFRSQCNAVGSEGPLPGDPFAALTQAYITEALSDAAGGGGPAHTAKADEIGRGALLIVVTGTGRAAKLLASVEGHVLRIHKRMSYDASGAEAAPGAPLRLVQSSRLDVTGGRVNPPEAESDVRWVRTGGVATLEPLNGAKIRALVAVPVVAHFMKSRDDFYQNNNVEDTFPISSLVSLLAPSATLNKIWRQAGVFFFLDRVERCAYLLDDFLPNAAGAIEAVPSPATDCLAVFNKINGGYNFRAAPSLDVYVWWSIGITGLVGYAAPHKKIGAARQEGAIWLDKACVDPNVNPFGDCGHTLAHEGGHFLALCHRCLTAPPPKACGFCLKLPDCGANDEGFLMRDDGRGQRIPVGDIGSARAKALERFKGSVRQRPN